MASKRKKLIRCSICFKPFVGIGHNALPINEGRCCDKCNKLVIKARVEMLNAAKSKTL